MRLVKLCVLGAVIGWMALAATFYSYINDWNLAKSVYQATDVGCCIGTGMLNEGVGDKLVWGEFKPDGRSMAFSTVHSLIGQFA